MQTRSSKSEDRCGICLESVKSRGIIDTCSHKFCFNCIKTWAQRENSCPICKRRFNKIDSNQAKSHPSSKTKPIKKESYKVSRKDQQDEEQRQIDATFDAFMDGHASQQDQERLLYILMGIEDIIAE